MNYFIQDNLGLVIIMGFILNTLVLYLIINIATRADKRAKYDWAQLEIMAKIAKAQGVSAEDIKATFEAIR